MIALLCRLRNSPNHFFTLNKTLTSSAANSPSKTASSEIEANKDGNSTIILSDACVKHLQNICKDEQNTFLRVIVDGGGCSGFQYKFELDNKLNTDDLQFGTDTSKVVIDKTSLEYCAGATVDYQRELIKSGFRIIANPKAEQGCSCGASFALKLD